jgi:diguanylate cyclase (GGDEF)-like protein
VGGARPPGRGGALSAGGAAHRLADVSYVLVGFVAAALVAARAWLVRDERAAWWLLAAGTASWALGNAAWDLLYRDAADPPFPSVSDAFWFGAYLPTYAGVALLIRRADPADPVGRGARWHGGRPRGRRGSPGARRGRPHRVADPPWVMEAVTIAYALADVMLIALCIAATALARGRLGRAWGALLLGLALKTAGDAGFIVVAASTPDGGALSIPWGLALVCVAVAAWQPLSRPIEGVTGGSVHVVPAAACIAALGVLAAGAAGTGALPVAAVLLAAATIVLTGVRIGFVVRDVQVLADSRRLAESDELTGLLNRRGFTHRLERALRDVRHGSSELALLLIDLNRFKEVNDTLGHQAGDLLLVQVADRLEATVPDAQLARIGGDEFVAVLRCGAERAVQVAERLREAIDQPVELDGLTTHTQASIGIAISPHHGGRRSDLLRHADAAMYRAKQRGTGVELYAAESDHNSRERLSSSPSCAAPWRPRPARPALPAPGRPRHGPGRQRRGARALAAPAPRAARARPLPRAGRGPRAHASPDARRGGPRAAPGAGLAAGRAGPRRRGERQRRGPPGLRLPRRGRRAPGRPRHPGGPPAPRADREHRHARGGPGARHARPLSEIGVSLSLDDFGRATPRSRTSSACRSTS